MSGRATTEIKLSPTRVAAHQRGPVKIGQVMPAVLERYGLDTPLAQRKLPRQVTMAAVWLGQQTLAELAEVS
jgi:hypothetical protein